MQTIKSWIEAVYGREGWIPALVTVVIGVLLVAGLLWFAQALIGVDVAGAINGWLQ